MSEEWSRHLRGVSEGFGSMAYSVRELCSLAAKEAAVTGSSLHPTECASAASLFHGLAKAYGASAEALGDGLGGVEALCDAMQHMKGDGSLAQAGNAAFGLLLNIMHVFVTQVYAQQTEVAERLLSVKAGVQGLKLSAAKSLDKETPRISRTPSAEPVATPVVAETRRIDNSASSAIPVSKEDVHADDEPHEEVHVKKKKKKGSKTASVSPPPEATDDAPAEAATVKEKRSKKHTMAPPLAEAAVENVLSRLTDAPKPSAQILKSATVVAPAPQTSSSAEQLFGSARPLWEPDFFNIVSTIGEAMSPLIRAAKPDVFAAPEDVMKGPVVQEYYIRLDPPGRIAPVCIRAWINLEEDIGRDFACDVLDVNSVTVDPFSFVGRRVVAKNEDNLSDLPACGWRLMTASGGSAKRLYTTYVFVDEPKTMPKSLIIHDAVVEGTRKDEVVSVFTPVPIGAVDPPYAHVRVFAAPTGGKKRGGAGANYAHAIGSMTKDVLAHSGFDEVEEDVVQEAIADIVAAAPSTTSDEVAADGDQNFVDPETLINKTRKKSAIGVAIGIGKTLALAPVAATKKVTTLFTNAAETAMLSQTDAKFVEWFPHLASEGIVDTFNCALSEGALKQGVLYITKHWLAFNATVLSKRFSVNFDDVRELRKAKFMKLFDNAIEVEMMDGDIYFLTSFLNRDQAFEVMFGAWRASGS